MKPIKAAPLLVLLATLAGIATAHAGIVGKGQDDPPATAVGGLALPPAGSRPHLQCWLEGRLIADETDPFVVSLTERPMTLVIRQADGRRSVVTIAGRLPSECFAMPQR